MPSGSGALGGAGGGGGGAGRGLSHTSIRLTMPPQPEPISSPRPVTQPPAPLPRYINRWPSGCRARMSGLPPPLKSPPANSASKPCQPEPICSALPVTQPPRPLPRYMSSAPAALRARMSGLPSPLQSPGASSAVKPCQPEPICSAWPVRKPPSPSPRYISSAPSDVRARMSGLPSPLQSRGASSAVKPCQPAPICCGMPVAKPPLPLPRYMSRRPSEWRARMSGLPSPLQSPLASSAVNCCQPAPICCAGAAQPPRPLPRHISSRPSEAAPSTSAAPSPLQSARAAPGTSASVAAASSAVASDRRIIAAQCNARRVMIDVVESVI